jgi:hypothetical protein
LHNKEPRKGERFISPGVLMPRFRRYVVRDSIVGSREIPVDIDQDTIGVFGWIGSRFGD